MKRFISILLVAILIVTSVATVAMAAGAATVAGSTKTAKAGEEVTLSFNVSGEFATFYCEIKQGVPRAQKHSPKDNGTIF